MSDDRNRTSVLRQLATLRHMKLPELQGKWRDLYGAEPPNFKSTFLKKRLAYRIQELFYGGLEDSVKAKLKEIASNETKKTKSQVEVNGKILPGTRFVREWQGQIYETTVRDDGFEFNGQMYRSLSAIATKITGTRWNGRKWWGLKKRQ